jgi:hypothetical protein
VYDATSAAGFGRADLTTFCRLDELGLEVIGQRVEPDRAVLACRVVEPDGSDERWCRRCGCEGTPRDSVDPGVGARAVRVAAHDVAGHGPPLPVRRVRARVAPGHQPGRSAAGEAVPPGPAVGSGGDRGRALDGCAGRRRAGGVVEHRQRRGPGRGPAGPDRRPGPVRRSASRRGRRARVAAHPTRRQVRHRHHRPHPDPRRHRAFPAAGHGRAAPSRRSRLGSQAVPRPGATASRWSRWTGSPGSRPPPPKNCPTRSR